MKKLFALAVAVVMILSTATVAFADPYSMANSGNYYAGVSIENTEVKVGEEVAVGVVVYDNTSKDLTVSGNINIFVQFDTSKFEYVSTSELVDWTVTPKTGEVLFAKANGVDHTFAADKTPFATITLKAIAEGEGEIGVEAENGTSNVANSTIYSEPFTEDGEMYGLAPVAVTVVAAGPTENVAEFVKDTVELTVEGETHNFTDVPVYEGTTSATSFKLKAVYGDESNYLKFNGSETIDVSNIKVDGEGTVTFQVAIIGKPAAVTIDKLVIE